MLNLLLRRPPLLLSEVDALRRNDTAAALNRSHKGLTSHLAEMPAVRKSGPLMPLLYTDGTYIDASDRRHPFRPGKKKIVYISRSHGDVGI